MSSTASFAKSPEQQLALLGHTFLESWIWERLDPLQADEEWLVDTAAREIWKYSQKFREAYSRPPTLIEFKDYVTQAEKDPKSARAICKTADECIAHAASFGADLVLANLANWWKMRQMAIHVTHIRDYWNVDETDKAEETFIAGALTLQRAATIIGHAPDKLESSVTRELREEAERARQANRCLSYGVSFLDDVTGGIAPNSLILIGAPPGAGKTQLVSVIAGHNSECGKRVKMFALEAEEFEIERRLKYQLLSTVYREKNPNDCAGLNYADWYMSKFEMPKSYDRPMRVQFTKKFSNLETFYRKWNDFGAKDLDREIYALKGEADLIIIDHLHYMDFAESENENRAVGTLVKHLRNMALITGIPIILVVHLKKKQGGEQRIISSLDDIHGTSNIQKMATTAILIGKAVGLTSVVSQGYPTFMRLAKHRIDAAGRTNAVGVSFYDSSTNSYHDKYLVGHMNWAETQWTPFEQPPNWAQNVAADIHLVEEG